MCASGARIGGVLASTSVEGFAQNSAIAQAVRGWETTRSTASRLVTLALLGFRVLLTLLTLLLLLLLRLLVGNLPGAVTSAASSHLND